MAAAATTKTKRKSTTAAKPATKRARKAAVADESESDVQPSGDDSAAASPSNSVASSDEDVKPRAKKPKGKAAAKKDGKGKGGKANGKSTTKKATKAKGRKSKGADSSDGSEYAAGDGSEEDEDDHDFESDATEGGVRVRVVRDVMEKKPAPKENGASRRSFPGFTISSVTDSGRTRRHRDSRDAGHPPDDDELSRSPRKEQRARMVQSARCVTGVREPRCTVHRADMFVRRRRVQVRRTPDRNLRSLQSDHPAFSRHALLNFNTFVKAWIPLATEADWQLPHLPAKDVTHWIYRDVRCTSSPVLVAARDHARPPKPPEGRTHRDRN